MKGAHRSVKKKRLQQTTNFDDWSETPLQNTHKATRKLTEHEGKEILDKLKNTTAYTQTVNQVDEIRNKLKQGEPLLSRKEIRRLKLPLQKSLVLNLKDDGYPGTSEYIKELIIIDDMYGKYEASRNLLRCNKSVLDTLAEGLKLAEEAKRKGNLTGEVQAFMDLGLHFRNSESSFYWLAQEMLEQSVELLDDPDNPVDSNLEAALRFVYSSFLFDILHDLPNAKFHLQRSMNLSKGKNYWFVNDDGEKSDMLYLKACVILSKIILEEAHEQKHIDLEEAITSCRSALRWAKQASDNYAIGTALLTLVQFYLAAGQLYTVLDLLEEYINLCKQYKFHRELCEGYVMLSKYYETVENDEKVIEVIEELIAFALEQEILDIVMKGHIKLFEMYGKRRMGKEMNLHAAAAYKYSKLTGNREAIDLSRCLIGIAVGDQLWSNYKHIVSVSDDYDSYRSWTKLINWKNLRLPFVSYVENLGIYQPEIEENFNMKHEYECTKKGELDTERSKSNYARSIISEDSIMKKSTEFVTTNKKPIGYINTSVRGSTASSAPESTTQVSFVI